ncbi:PfkB family carbohydrate kinase [Roseococcus sp. DSY-14]|uniref:PfkB family carbohydrate kinase n=1 Tax=Roseococcus sp. DSY-14 TaxID=3369650 RepID=UPI00387AD5A6
MATGHVAVIGSFNADLVLDLPRMAARGETLAARALHRFPGGKGSNQAIAAARAGARVTMLASLGTDAEGDAALALWAREGVQARAVRHPVLPTGMAVILLEGGDNRIILAPGANMALAAADAAPPPCDVVLAQLEVPAPAIAAAFAAAGGARRVLNAAPADAAAATRLLPLTDILLVNAGEAMALAPAAGQDAAALAQALAGQVGQAAVVTAGPAGAVLAMRGGAVLRAPAPPVAVRDTTGAGDAFAGAFCAALAGGADHAAALRAGVAAGSLACTVLGAVPSLPHRAAIAALLDEGLVR